MSTIHQGGWRRIRTQPTRSSSRSVASDQIRALLAQLFVQSEVIPGRSRVQRTALLVGNSDGIGLATTRRLLAAGWKIVGVSRSQSPITDQSYQHCVADVSDQNYKELLNALALKDLPDLCIYFVGIGLFLDVNDMTDEARVIDVNFTAMVKTASTVVPLMVERGRGHFIGISSFADELTSAEAPSYFASKAGFSSYLRGLGLAVRSKGIHVTNIRFGFVDTKMAKGDFRPLMMTVEKAVDHVQHCIDKKPSRHSAPRIAIPLIKCLRLILALKGV